MLFSVSLLPDYQEDEVGASSPVDGVGFMRLYDGKVYKIMRRDLINITQEEIDVSAAKSAKSDGALIMYLQNNGKGAHKPNSDDIDAWIKEDIDD